MDTDILGRLNRNGTGLTCASLATTLVEAESRPRARRKTPRSRCPAAGRAGRGADENPGAGRGPGHGCRATRCGPSDHHHGVDPARRHRPGPAATARPQVEVISLALRQVLEFPGFTARDAALETGTLSVEFGQWVGGHTRLHPDSRTHGGDDHRRGGHDAAGPGRASVAVAGMTARVLTKGDGTFSLGIVGETGAATALRGSPRPAPAARSVRTGPVRLRHGRHANATAAGAGRPGRAGHRRRHPGVARSTNDLTDIIPGMSITLSWPRSSTITVERGQGHRAGKHRRSWSTGSTNPDTDQDGDAAGDQRHRRG